MKPNPLIRLVALLLVPCLLANSSFAAGFALFRTPTVRTDNIPQLFNENALAPQPGISERTNQPGGYFYRSLAGQVLRGSKVPAVAMTASTLFLIPDVVDKARSLAEWWAPEFRHAAHPSVIAAGIGLIVLEIGLLWRKSPARRERVRVWMARPLRPTALLLAVAVVNITMAVNTQIIGPLIRAWHRQSALLSELAAKELFSSYDILEQRAAFMGFPLGQYYLESARSQFLVTGPQRLAQEWDELSRQPNMRQVIEQGVLTYPEYWSDQLLQLTNGDRPEIPKTVLAILKSSKSRPVQRFVEVYECQAPKEIKQRLFTLLDSMVSRRLTLKQAIHIAEDNVTYLHELTQIFEKPDAVAWEMVRSALEFDSLEDRKPFQFALIEKPALWPQLSLDELYLMLGDTAHRLDSGTHWPDLFRYWLRRMRESGQFADTVLTRTSHWHFSDILLGAKTQDLTAFLDAFGPEERKTILQMSVQKIENEFYSLQWTWTTVEIGLQLKDPGEIRVLADTLHNAYDQVSGKNRDSLLAHYGLVAAYLYDAGKTNDNWCRQMSARYQPPPIAQVRDLSPYSDGFERLDSLVRYIGRGELTYRRAIEVTRSGESYLHFLMSRPTLASNDDQDWGTVLLAAESAGLESSKGFRDIADWTPDDLWGPRELFALFRAAQTRSLFLVRWGIQMNAGLLALIDERLKARHETIVDLFESTGYFDYSMFMEIAAKQHRLGQFLDRLSDAQRKLLLERYIGKLAEGKSDSNDLIRAVTIDTIMAIRDPGIRTFIEQELRKRYEAAERKGDQKAKAMYVMPLGVLAEGMPHPDAWLSRMLSIYKPLNAQTLTKLRDNFKKYDRVLTLMPLIGGGELDFARAAEFADDDVTYMHFLFDLESKNKKISGFDLEEAKKSAALSLMVRVNELQTSSDSVQLAAVASFDAESLYKLLVYSENELYAITFDRLYGRLMHLIDAQGSTRDMFLDRRVKRQKFRSFIRLCARFNLLDDFLKPMSQSTQSSLLQSFVTGIENDTDELTQAVAVADTFGMIHDRALLDVLNGALHQQYDHMVQTKNVRGKIIYGLLVGLFGNNSVVNDTWVRQMAAKYKVPNVLGMSSAPLFNAEQVNVQRYIFYESGDGDGVRSFESFMKQYEGASDYTVTPHDTYVVVEGRLGNRRLLMYANKPHHEVDGQDDIDKALAAAKQVPTVMVHRGHNTFVHRTIERIGPEIQIVWLGNCGGDKELAEIVAKAPNVQLFSTKETGTMRINDPALRDLNDQLLRLSYYDWEKLWAHLEKRWPNDPDFKNYIPPSRNVAALFLKAYHQMLPKETAGLVIGPLLLDGELAIMRYVMAWRGKQTAAVESPYASLEWDGRTFSFKSGLSALSKRAA